MRVERTLSHQRLSLSIIQHSFTLLWLTRIPMMASHAFIVFIVFNWRKSDSQ